MIQGCVYLWYVCQQCTTTAGGLAILLIFMDKLVKITKQAKFPIFLVHFYIRKLLKLLIHIGPWLPEDGKCPRSLRGAKLKFSFKYLNYTIHYFFQDSKRISNFAKLISKLMYHMSFYTIYDYDRKVTSSNLKLTIVSDTAWQVISHYLGLRSDARREVAQNGVFRWKWPYLCPSWYVFQ